jgi:hypothetical protein
VLFGMRAVLAGHPQTVHHWTTTAKVWAAAEGLVIHASLASTVPAGDEHSVVSKPDSAMTALDIGAQSVG